MLKLVGRLNANSVFLMLRTQLEASCATRVGDARDFVTYEDEA